VALRWPNWVYYAINQGQFIYALLCVTDVCTHCMYALSDLLSFPKKTFWTSPVCSSLTCGKPFGCVVLGCGTNFKLTEKFSRLLSNVIFLTLIGSSKCQHRTIGWKYLYRRFRRSITVLILKIIVAIIRQFHENNSREWYLKVPRWYNTLRRISTSSLSSLLLRAE